LLTHLRAAGAAVGAPVGTREGGFWIEVRAAEGPRTLAVFEYLPGVPPGLESGDVGLMGEVLARIHEAGQSYAGPTSLYRLEADHLLNQPLSWLLAAPTLGEDAQQGFADLGEALRVRVAACAPQLSDVACHGDCHGGNTHMADGPDGSRTAAFFDFDDGGPGYLAYDLAVYLWAQLIRQNEPQLNEAGRTRWKAFIEGYRRVRAIPEADFEAIVLFLSMRQIWLAGEYASRFDEFGSNSLPPVWLGNQMRLMQGWADLTTAEVVGEAGLEPGGSVP
jgi:Ser/Thr protein kinase RdoA (MazF antagonist)